MGACAPGTAGIAGKPPGKPRCRGTVPSSGRGPYGVPGGVCGGGTRRGNGGCPGAYAEGLIPCVHDGPSCPDTAARDALAALTPPWTVCALIIVYYPEAACIGSQGSAWSKLRGSAKGTEQQEGAAWLDRLACGGGGSPPSCGVCATTRGSRSRMSRGRFSGRDRRSRGSRTARSGSRPKTCGDCLTC